MVLTDRVAIVTGAASGIGAAIARAYGEAGAALVLADRDDAGLRATAQALGDAPHEVVAGDLLADGAPEALVATALARFGRLDVVVNAAGVLETHGIDGFPAEVFDRIMAINVRAPFL